MGSNASKPNGETAVVQKNQDVDDNFDPRSPTPEIVRTPLHGKGGGKHNITKNVDLRKTFENPKGDEKLIHNNPILSAVIKNHFQSYDPRSPTQDFDRTPIVIAADIDEVANDKRVLRLQNENCGSPSLRDDNENNLDDSVEATSPELVVPKNLCDGFFDLSLNGTIKGNEEPLGSSTASNEAIEENISSNAGNATKLLETNFDYVETGDDKFENSEEYIMKAGEDSYELIKGIPQFKILNDDPRSPSIGIERTPIVVSKKNLNTGEENVEEMSDDTLIKVLQNTNAELRQNIPKPQDKNPEGLLIYEDEATLKNDTPKKSKSTDNSGCRTPLSCMKNKTDGGHTRSKSANTLYGPKTQSIVQNKRASHIPRLKSLTKPSTVANTGSNMSLKNITRATAISGDCENTPPHSHRDKWDKDSSIVL